MDQLRITKSTSTGNVVIMISLLSFLILMGWIISISHSFLPRYFDFSPDKAVRTSVHAELDDNSQEVSDAEALLACYAYLKRRKRIGDWAQKERRQRMKIVAQPHYFWEEDLSKIAARLQKEMQGGIVLEDQEDLDGEGEGESRMRPSRTSSAAEVWSGEFTSFPTDPSPTRSRRSQSAKQTWADPDFRERWYQRRWGNNKVKKKKDQETLEEMELERKVRELPTGFLGSPELSSMTEAEIASAIRTFLTQKNKRIVSRKKTLATRKVMLQKQMEDAMSGTSRSNTTSLRLSRDSLISPEESALKQAQRQRSERAKQLYKKRLENKKQEQDQEISQPIGHKYQPIGLTPQDAMVRIQQDLSAKRLPAVKDVEVIMKPGKIGKRRDILRKILLDHFDMRGKCVPTSGSDDLEFVTQCPIDDLGLLVIDMIRKENKKANAKKKS